MSTIEKLKEIFRDVFDDEALIITSTTSPDDITEWDSLAQITIISQVQDAFEIEFEIEEITAFENVESLLNVIERKLG